MGEEAPLSHKSPHSGAAALPAPPQAMRSGREVAASLTGVERIPTSHQRHAADVLRSRGCAPSGCCKWDFGRYSSGASGYRPRRIGMVPASDGVRLRDSACCLPHQYPASPSLRRAPNAPMFHASPCEHTVTLLVCADAGIIDGSARLAALRPHDRLSYYGGRVGPLVCVWRPTTTTPAIFFYGASVRA